MQLSGSPPERGGRVEIDADMIPGQWGGRAFGQIHGILELVGNSFWKGNGSTSFEVAIKLFQGPFPAVAFVRHQALQHCQGRGLGIRASSIFNRTRKGRTPVEVGLLGKISSDLSIWIQAGLVAAEQLQYETVAVQNRGGTLLG